ncbi:long-chain fatty acid transport protein 4-like isoform X1 [Sitophilus oryzae]|uniref:Very long-chain fatty acid transport protein n=2 Tax=Sitophilus oryzae TaxID=7048 RepID=A0A6J2YTI1_SITOR|nr:long-chain fatty acid transport protein 4-like isoform X1 [Sitophilus oryzae]
MIMYVITCLLLIFFSLLINKHKFIVNIVKTLPRDFLAIRRMLKLNWRLNEVEKNGDTICKIFGQIAKKYPHKIALYYENEKWTYRELDLFSNQIANYFASKGYVKHDTVSLLLENRPEYIAIWLGLSKIGVITALINTNLTSNLLIHSLKVASSKGFIFGSDFSKAVSDITDSIADIHLFEFNDKCKDELLQQPSTLPDEILNVKLKDTLCYVYTSGTTGLPKAAPISHKKLVFLGYTITYMLGLTEKDTFYNPLPLYHVAGGLFAISQTLLVGIPIVLKKKFSVKNYWTDCEKFGCTISNYIGEICRYLLSVHNPDKPVNHKVQKMFGNGLRPEMWDAFVKTFKIPHMYEVYGSTEGNASLVNLDSKTGAIGFLPIWAKFLTPESIIKCDPDTGEPIRNSKGFCIRCKTNEPGLMVGKISTKKEFLGYTDEKATQKKILLDVFTRGDRYFNTGDILVQDELGYFYFKDRTGDTFRWKGENVATSEVEGVVTGFLKFYDVIVYGVEIPGTEGKAGMVAIVDQSKTIDLKELAKELKCKLPSYAIPIFLRILLSAPITGTFKLQKVDLKKEGFDVNRIKDDLYFYDAKVSEYVPLTTEIYENIISGKIKL